MANLQELLDLGRRDEARAESLAILKTQPTDAEALSTLARLELENGQVDAAQLLLARISPNDRDYYEVLLSEAMVLQLSEDPDGARLAFAELTVAFPTRPEAFFALGVSLLDKQDAMGAVRSLAQATKLQPTHFLYHYRFAEALAQAGEFVDAATELTRTIELRPDFTAAYTAFARMLEADGKLVQALEVVGAGLGSMPTDRKLLAEQARLRMASGDLEGALAALDGTPETGVRLAEDLIEAKAFTAAVEVCNQLEAKGQRTAKVSLVKGLAHEAAGRTEEALKAYAEAAALDPSDWAPPNNRGLLLLEDFPNDPARLEEATVDLTEAVRRAAGKQPAALFNLALLHGRRQRWAEASALANQVVAHPAAGPLKAQAEQLLKSLKKAAPRA
jgi:tetratricopeptide (TPR) repeat protein